MHLEKDTAHHQHSSTSLAVHGLIIFVLSLIIFYPALHSGFINWDDPSHILENAQVRSLSWSNIQTIFSSHVQRTYMPLTVLSYAFEYSFVKFDPWLYHFNNVVLHLFLLVLIYSLILRLSLSSTVAFFSTLVFAIHPMHVEPVVWITGRKDLLYSIFYLLSIHTYWYYLKKGQLKYFFMTFVLALLSMLSKPSAISLPLVLCLFDWLSGRKEYYKIVLEKVILIIPIAFLAWLTLKGNTAILSVHTNFLQALLLYVWSFTFYIIKFFVPYKLSPVYMVPSPVSLFQIHFVISCFVFLFSAGILWRFRLNKWLKFSFLFYFCSIFFLLRYDENLPTSFVADRYMYLPSLGFCLLLGWGMDVCSQKLNQYKNGKKIAFSLIFCFMVTSTAMAHSLCRIWKNDFSLWNYVIKTSPQEPKGYGARGLAYKRNGQYQESLLDFNKAIALDVSGYKSYNNRALLFKDMKKIDLALQDFNQSVEINPYFFKTFLNRGKIFKEKGRLGIALNDFNRAIELRPDFAGSYLNRGNVFQMQGKLELALNDYNLALAIVPDYPEAYHNRGNIYYLRGQQEQALKEYNMALQLNPQLMEAQHNKLLVLENLRRTTINISNGKK